MRKRTKITYEQYVTENREAIIKASLFLTETVLAYKAEMEMR